MAHELNSTFPSLVLLLGAVSLSTASYFRAHDENGDENESGSDGAEKVGFLTQENEGNEVRGGNFQGGNERHQRRRLNLTNREIVGDVINAGRRGHGITALMKQKTT